MQELRRDSRAHVTSTKTEGKGKGTWKSCMPQHGLPPSASGATKCGRAQALPNLMAWSDHRATSPNSNAEGLFWRKDACGCLAEAEEAKACTDIPHGYLHTRSANA